MVKKSGGKKKESSGKLLATASLILGVIALIFSWVPFFGIILAIVAIIVAGTGLSKKANKGLVITGLVLGIIALLIALLISLLFGAVLSVVNSGDFEFVNDCNNLCEEAYDVQAQIDVCSGSCYTTDYSGNDAQKETMLNTLREIRDR